MTFKSLEKSMNKDILAYIQQNNGAELAVMQQKFGIPYKEAKAIVNELVSDGTLAYESGLRYSYIKKQDTLDERRAELERRRAEAIRKVHENLSEDDDEEDDAKERARAERQAYLEARRQELIKRMQADMNEDDNEEDDEEEIDDEDEQEIDEEELRFRALKLCIEENVASVSLFQRSLPIGYVRACKLMNWMESNGYVSEAQDFRPRKVLITKEEFEKLYSEPRFVEEEKFDDEEFNDEEDKKFAGYERYLREHFPNVEDDGGKLIGCDEFMEQLFGPDVKKKDAPLLDLAKRNEAAQNLVNILSQIIAKKSAPISADVMPAHTSWDNENEFNNCVMDRLERLIKSDEQMGQKGAVKKAETYLEAVRDTHDGKMVEVYERLVYEIKNISSYLYKQLKKQYFGG